MSQPVFHVELRQFPHVARTFNLTAEELQQQFIAGWISGAPVELNERKFSPEKAKLAIIEGPRLELADMAMGRGWANAARTGTDVTERLLARAQDETAAFKETLLTSDARTLPAVVALAAQRHPEWLPSRRLALAEQAVWELLHQGRIELEGIPREEWQPLLLRWESWTAPDVTLVRP